MREIDITISKQLITDNVITFSFFEALLETDEPAEVEDTTQKVVEARKNIIESRNLAVAPGKVTNEREKNRSRANRNRKDDCPGETCRVGKRAAPSLRKVTVDNRKVVIESNKFNKRAPYTTLTHVPEKVKTIFLKALFQRC